MLRPSYWLLPIATAAGLPGQDSTPPPPPDAAATALDAITAVRTKVAALCGHAFRAEVSTRTQTHDELRAYMLRKLDLELGDGRLERMDAWLHCMALLGPDQDYRDEVTALLVGQAAGVYDASNKVLYVLDLASNASDWLAQATLAHELAHALDDQHVALQQLLEPGGTEPTKDHLFAVGAAIEGSAIAVSDAWAAATPPPEGYDPMADPGARRTAVQANAALVAAPPYCTLLLGRHLAGRMFFAAGRKLRAVPDGTYLGLLSIQDDLPASTEQVLHPEKYWLPADREAPVVLANAAQLAESIADRTSKRVLGQNTLGELVAGVLAQPIDRKLNPARTRRIDAWTNAASTGWGGDRLFLVGDDGGTAGKAVTTPGVVWITAWDSVADRDEFAAALQQYRGSATGVAMHTAGRTAVFAFGSARTLDEPALAALLSACRFEQAGQPWVP